MRLLQVVTISVDLDGSGFYASCADPAVSAKGDTASNALRRLTLALRQAREPAKPSSNVIAFPSRQGGA